MSTNDVKNPSKPQIISRKLERIQDDLYIDMHILKENKAEKCNHGEDWLRKALWYSPAKMDNRLFKNVYSSKFFPGSLEQLDHRINNIWKNFSLG